MIQERRIDFNKLSKPANLQNSAVLRMLEEEEQRKRLGKPGLRRVEWPPTKEGSLDYVDFVEQSPVQSKTRAEGERATYQSKSPALREEAVAWAKATGQPNDQASPSRYDQGGQPWRRQTEAPQPSADRAKGWASVSPQPTASRPHQRQQQQQQFVAPPQSQPNAPRSWSSVRPREYIVPVSCPWKSEAPGRSSTGCNEQSTSDLPSLDTWKPQSWTQHRPQIQIKQTPATPIGSSFGDEPRQFGDGAWNGYPRQHNLTVSQEVESPQSYYKPQSSAVHLEPPATLITLRAEPPISQEPSPVYQAQPAATEAAYDGINMRGDQKWPPASVKQQTEAENRARIELAKGPACRPRKVHKDYSGFFAQHAVTNNYPGYRAPPGTQFFTPAYQH
ncbi:uncharacterized protein LOC131668256 isoform X2 [Phymastichus coffea]|uniref:uncharacterized protein LOC131668256 isoform X2 n=1 Tax=Phymastichus coffea TaxID=108790 RepID=UPI00273C3499|nr:uncharacterized protein LOC131668256 isoform X2 [Phymastichus coffea]